MFKISFSNPIIKTDMEEIFLNVPESTRLFHKKIYISGASGMIASYLVSFFIWLNEEQNAGIEIYAGIRNRQKCDLRFGEYAKKSCFHLIQKDVLFPLPDDVQPDYVIHAASLASPQYYGLYPVETMLPNVVGTYQLLEYARNHDVDGFLFFSSGAVYGTAEGSVSISENSIGLLDYLARGNSYGESKRCGEALCFSYSDEYHVPVKIARIHHTYGPTIDIDNDSRVFSEFVGNIVKYQDIVIKSSGESKRAFCYITDTISALLIILLNGKNGEAYNVGNPDEYIRIRDLAAVLTSLFPERNLSAKFEKRQNDAYVSSPNSRLVPLDVGRLKGLGWENKVSIKEGFMRTVQAIEYEKRQV